MPAKMTSWRLSMAISEEMLDQAIVRIASVEGVHIDYAALTEDVLLLSASFPDERDFAAVVMSTVRALDMLSQGLASSAELKGNRAGWYSYHYQHSVAQGAPADMRIEWRRVDDVLYVRGFGHRYKPVDFYTRVAATRR